jgi:hypothetical protein
LGDIAQGEFLLPAAVAGIVEHTITDITANTIQTRFMNPPPGDHVVAGLAHSFPFDGPVCQVLARYVVRACT